MLKHHRPAPVEPSHTPSGALDVFDAFMRSVRAIPADQAERLAAAHTSRRNADYTYEGTAERVANLLYDTKRIDEDTDTVIDAAADTGGLASLVGDDGPAAGCAAYDVAIAILTRDLIDAEDYDTLTGWWIAERGPMPGTAGRLQIGPAVLHRTEPPADPIDVLPLAYRRAPRPNRDRTAPAPAPLPLARRSRLRALRSLSYIYAAISFTLGGYALGAGDTFLLGVSAVSLCIGLSAAAVCAAQSRQ